MIFLNCDGLNDLKPRFSSELLAKCGSDIFVAGGLGINYRFLPACLWLTSAVAFLVLEKPPVHQIIGDLIGLKLVFLLKNLGIFFTRDAEDNFMQDEL